MPHVCSPHMKDKNLDFMSNVCAPIEYAVAFKKHVGPNRLFNLKSHDHHVLIQLVLPSGIKSLLQPRPRFAIIQRICTKVVVPNEIGPLRTYVVETLCMLEIWFPLGFFDPMTHLLVHIVDELEICGPMASRWCYPMECYLAILNNYV